MCIQLQLAGEKMNSEFSSGSIHDPPLFPDDFEPFCFHVIIRFEEPSESGYSNYYELYRGKLIDYELPSPDERKIIQRIVERLNKSPLSDEYRICSLLFHVHLFSNPDDDAEESDTVVRPDITVFKDRKRVGCYGFMGAPDLIVEVLSEATKYNDRYRKYSLYEEAGVSEYWIVDPVSKTVAIHLLSEGKYGSPEVIPANCPVPNGILKNIVIDFPDFTI